ncbi:VOC family protein [Pararhodobacter sp. SW119]|uniref:VOC family protein n=1 Tax=Pararhodobacter sp. SW119 TaxID=2780075 RepID=UPI001ADEE451|nr:VOC family protein [Pararhodobacter sp. SW119]
MSDAMSLPIDHFVIPVRDLQAARDAWIGAGFVASPISYHDSGLGTANSCIVFENSYIELMGVVEPTEANAGWRALRDAGPGLRGVALRSDGIEASAEALSRHGLAHDPIRRFARRVGSDELRFSVIRIARSETPGLLCLFCQHHTPELFWTPAALAHPNGARRIVGAALPGIAALRPLATAEPADISVEEGADRLRLLFASNGVGVETDALAGSCGLVLKAVAG